MVNIIYSNIQIYIYIYYSNIIYQALFLKLKTQPPSRRARYYGSWLSMLFSYDKIMVILKIISQCELLNYITNLSLPFPSFFHEKKYVFTRKSFLINIPT